MRAVSALMQPPDLRKIWVTEDLTTMTDGCILSLQEQGETFVRAGRLVHIVSDELGFRRIREAQSAWLREKSTSAANWCKAQKDGANTFKLVMTPNHVIDTLEARGQWNLPAVRCVVEAPCLRPDGTVLQKSGYDEKSGIYACIGGKFPEVKESPDDGDLRAALITLTEPISEFPFEQPWHFAAAVAAILTACGREAIVGAAPLFVLDGTVAGAGKGLFCSVVSIIATGGDAAMMKHTENEEEDRKRLLSMAICGDRLVCLDECASLATPSVNMALTTGTVRDRALGGNEMVTAHWRPTWMATGNNIRYLGDTDRRVIPVRLAPTDEQPEQHKFKIERLRDWTARNRPKLLHAALTILRYWTAKGCPRNNAICPMGSFEEWTDLVRGVVVYMGLQDPYLGVREVKAMATDGAVALGRIMAAWMSQHGTFLKTAREIVDNSGETKDLLMEVAKNKRGECTAESVGYYLRKTKGRVVGGLRMVAEGSEKTALKWRPEWVQSVGEVT